MKHLKFLMMAFVTAFISIGLASCGNDDDASNLSGVYGCERSNGYGSCYYFSSGGTVVYYGSAHKGKTGSYGGMLAAYERIGGSKWYCCEGERGYTYSYVADGNKVIIPMKGTILTVSGKTITEDGGSTYRK